jgi:hypothetical protein
VLAKDELTLFEKLFMLFENAAALNAAGLEPVYQELTPAVSGSVARLLKAFAHLSTQSNAMAYGR